MSSSVLGNVFLNNLLPGSSSAAVAALNKSVRGANTIANIASWQPLINVGACVERPIPPAESPQPQAPSPSPAPAERDPEIIVAADRRERPGITSKTRSVGKKLKLIDHRSFYGFDPRAGGAAIPWSSAIDPIRFLTGRLWTIYPELHMVGETADLFGKTVRFGNKVPGLDRLNDPEGTVEWIKTIDFDRSKLESESLEEAYKQIMLEGSVAPIFADMVEVGKVGIDAGQIFRSNPDFLDNVEIPPNDPEFNSPTFQKFLFGNGPMPLGAFVPGEAFEAYLIDTPLSVSGLFTTIGSQQSSYGMYSDYSFEYSMPISSINLEHYGNISKPLSAKIEPVYNFYCRPYEIVTNALRDSPIPEHLMPNIYSLLSEKFSKQKDSDLPTEITNFLRLNPTTTTRSSQGDSPDDRIKNFLIDQMNSRGEKISEKSKGLSYCKKWARAVYGMVEDGSWQTFGATYRGYMGQIFPHEEDRLYLRLKEGKASFPMLVDITFSTDRTAPIADAIARTKLDCVLSEYILNGPYESEEVSRIRQGAASYGEIELGPSLAHSRTGFIEAKEFILRGSPGSNTKVDSEIYINTIRQEDSSTAGDGRRSYDFEEWIRSIDSMDVANNTSIIFGSGDSVAMAGRGPLPGKQEVLPLFRAYLVAKIRDLVKEEGKFRSLSEVYSGKMCYNETLCYRIEKWGYNFEGNLELVSQYIVPNKSETEEAMLTDTQVKYGRRYIYRIYAVNLVIGNEYFYIFPHNVPGNAQHVVDTLTRSKYCELHYCNYPSVRMIETPYFNSHERDQTIATQVTDSPPPPPLVSINAYKGVANKLLITFNGGIGDFVAEPIVVRPGTDMMIINKIRESQMAQLASLEKNDLTIESLSKIRFKSDDPASAFEIYRTTEEPKSYSDFGPHLIEYLQTAEKVNSLGFIDTISPNTKYYYIFRTIDVHSYFSNPTCIYCVEMVSENGLIYPIIKTYHLGENKDTKVPTKDFQKFLEIKPNTDQMYLNLEASGIDGVKNLQTSDIDGSRFASVFPARMEDFTEGAQFVLGDMNNPDNVWGRTFKIRITSKHSGRKIDLNVKFDYKDLVKASDFYLKDEEN